MRVEPHSKVVSRQECVYPLRRQDIYVMEGVGFGEGHIDHRLDRRAAPAGLVDATRSQIAFVGGAPSKAGR